MWLWFVLGLLVLIFLWYRWSISKVGAFESQGIPTLQPIPFVGTSDMNILMNKKAIIDDVLDKYSEMKQHKVWAQYFFGTPTLVINDLDLVREIAVKNADHFMDIMMDQSDMNKVQTESNMMLTSLSGEEWKAMRAALSPTFSPNKLKGLVQTLDSTGPEFTEYLKKQVAENKEVFDMKDVFGKFTMAAIAKAAFGVDARVFEDEESEFVKQASHLLINSFSFKLFIVYFLYHLVPKLAVALGLRMQELGPFEYLGGVLDDVMTTRANSSQASYSKPRDMLQVLLDHRDKYQHEEIQQSEMERFEADAQLKLKVEPKKMLTDDAIKQSVMLFLFAGFDTVSDTLSMITYHLATNLEVQQHARQCVDDFIASQDEEEDWHLSYEELGKLEYLDMVISESQRLAPVAVGFDRFCTKDYTTSTGIEIKKGQRIQIFTAGIHMDPQYWKDPEKFEPERFSKENKANVRPYAFLPFGVGPRSCIGIRFALLEVKIALFHLLKEFEIWPSEKTPIPAEYDKTRFQTTINGGNHLRLIPREK